MNYSVIYDKLIQKAKYKVRNQGVYEKHHILPKSLGGDNSSENIVLLTPKEHYVAHHLLWKIHRNKEMHYAFWLMVNCASRDGNRSYKVNSKTYEIAKIEHSKQVSESMTGRKKSEETKRRASVSLKGKPAWNKGLTGVYSEDSLLRMSIARTGFVESQETRDKKSKSHRGVKRGPSPLIGVPRPIGERYFVTCPHCNKNGVEWNMLRYHFDNCKFKEKENLSRCSI